jgi:hypothetical protein
MNWGQIGVELGKHHFYKAAEVAFLKSFPEAENLYNHANVLRRVQRYEEAEVYAKRALEMYPGGQDIQALLGLLRLDLNDAEGACEILAKTVHISGYYRFCYSLACLHAGRYAEGFKEYDGRLTAGDMPLPLWTGEPTEGKTIAIYSEQGFGDTIMYSRFLENLPFKHFVLVPNALQRLIPNAVNSNCSFQADYMLPLMSLPYRIGATGIPPWKPYISPPQRFTLPRAPDTKLTIGLVWRSKSGSVVRKPEEVHHGEMKSCPLEYLLPLAAIEGVKLYSLQVDEAQHDIARLGAQPLIENLAPRMMDFSDLAGFMCSDGGAGMGDGIDLIVSVDTAPAHLAGALGKPGIVLLSSTGSWQWQSSDRTPWYPTLDLIRQKAAGDWQSVADQLLEKVKALAASR